MLKRAYRYIFVPYRREYRGTITDDDGRRIKCYRRISRWDDFWGLVLDIALDAIEWLLVMLLPVALIALVIAWLILLR